MTAWPSAQLIFSTFPPDGASTGISIFIDSRMTQVCPSVTDSPSFTSIFQTVPVMCAFTLVAMAAACVHAKEPSVEAQA